MPVEPQARRVERHERILDAAAQVFATKGYHGTLVDEIALAAETSKGGVYFHFPNKQAIFLALLDRLAALLRERIAGAIAEKGAPLERADAALRVVLETFGGHRRLARLFLVEALGAGPEFNARMLAIRAQFAGLIKTQLDAAVQSGAIPPVDTATASTAWFGAINEVVTQWVLAERPGRLEAAYPTIRALLLHGILSPPPAGPSAPSATAGPSTATSSTVDASTTPSSSVAAPTTASSTVDAPTAASSTIGPPRAASSTIDPPRAASTAVGAAPSEASAAAPSEVVSVAPNLGDAPPGAATTAANARARADQPAPSVWPPRADAPPAPSVAPPPASVALPSAPSAASPSAPLVASSSASSVAPPPVPPVPMSFVPPSASSVASPPVPPVAPSSALSVVPPSPSSVASSSAPAGLPPSARSVASSAPAVAPPGSSVAAPVASSVEVPSRPSIAPARGPEPARGPFAEPPLGATDAR